MAHTLDMTFGPEAEYFSTAAAIAVETHCFDDTRFFVSYAAEGIGVLGQVSIGIVSGSTITFGSGNVFNNAHTNPISSDRLEDNKIVVAYTDRGDSFHGTAKIGDVSGTTVVFGPEYEFLTGSSQEVRVVSLTSTKFIVAYRDQSDSNHGTAKIGTVSGTTITYGSEFEFLSTGGVSHIGISRLSDDKFVLAFRNESAANFGDIVIGDVSGTTIAFGTTQRFLNFAIKEIEIAAFNANKFVLVHNGITSPAVIGTVSGTTMTFGASVQMSPTDGWNLPAVAILDSDHFVVTSRDRSQNNGLAAIGNVDGTIITVGAETLFNTPINGTAETTVCVFDNSKFVVIYRDDFDGGHGTAKIGTIPVIANSLDFFIEAPADPVDPTFFASSSGTPESPNLDLVITGPNVFASSSGTPESPNLDLFMTGEMVDVPQPSSTIRIINHLTKAQDYDPQLISKFMGDPTSVNIQLWDLIDGVNTEVPITSSGCYNIGDTDRWAWSTEHLLFIQNKNKYHYYFKMISNLGEEMFGEFLIDVPEGVLWSSPD